MGIPAGGDRIVTGPAWAVKAASEGLRLLTVARSEHTGMAAAKRPSRSCDLREGTAPERRMRMSGLVRRWRPILLLAAIAAGVTWGSWRAWDVQRHRTALAEIQEEMDHGRHGTAVRKLNGLL